MSEDKLRFLMLICEAIDTLNADELRQVEIRLNLRRKLLENNKQPQQPEVSK